MLLLRMYLILTAWAFFTHYTTHAVRQINCQTELTYLLTYLLHATQSFVRS